MTPSARLAAALSTLHWPSSIAARVLSRNERTIRRWLSGQNAVPAEKLAWLEWFAGQMRENPPPGRLEARGGSEASEPRGEPPNRL